jgi:uncharacterized membrane protein
MSVLFWQSIGWRVLGWLLIGTGVFQVVGPVLGVPFGHWGAGALLVGVGVWVYVRGIRSQHALLDRKPRA